MGKVEAGADPHRFPLSWGALSNLGAGGLASARTSNAANAILFAIMIFTVSPLPGHRFRKSRTTTARANPLTHPPSLRQCFFGASVVAKIGPKWALVVGTLGYAPYAAGLYTNSKFGTQWSLILGAVVCGLSAGVFWATEGGVAIAYPEPERRGRSISIWLILNQLGSVVGGSINLALNVRTDGAGGVGVRTYVVFVALQCLGPVVALLLSSPEKVQRRDGRPVRISSGLGFWAEARATLRVWARPHTLILTIVFIQCQWGGAVTGTYVSPVLSHQAVTPEALN